MTSNLFAPLRAGGLALAKPGPATCCVGGEKGYVDYAALAA